MYKESQGVVRRRKKGKVAGAGGKNLGKGEGMTPFGTSRISLTICTPLSQWNSRVKRHICEAYIRGISKHYRENVPKERCTWRYLAKVRESEYEIDSQKRKPRFTEAKK